MIFKHLQVHIRETIIPECSFTAEIGNAVESMINFQSDVNKAKKSGITQKTTKKADLLIASIFVRYVCADLICFPCCFTFSIYACLVSAVNPEVWEAEWCFQPGLRCFPKLPRSAKWLCCDNPDISAKGCQTGPHPEQISFFENLLPAGLLNRDQGSLSHSVSMYT